jgi:hypothetical protein
MISSKPYNAKCLVITVLCVLSFCSLYSQYKWDRRDPVDLGTIDLGDNKVLLYNGIALGLIHFLSEERIKVSSSERFHSLQFEYYQEYRKKPLSTVISIKKRTGWKWRKVSWLGYETSILGILDDSFIGGIGITPFFTWNIINSKKWRISYDNGVGPTYFFSSFPEDGTSFNFSTFYGLEFEYNSSNLSFSLGARNTHISNAGIWGRDRNPGFDGIGFYINMRY